MKYPDSVRNSNGALACKPRPDEWGLADGAQVAELQQWLPPGSRLSPRRGLMRGKSIYFNEDAMSRANAFKGLRELRGGATLVSCLRDLMKLVATYAKKGPVYVPERRLAVGEGGGHADSYISVIVSLVGEELVGVYGSQRVADGRFIGASGQVYYGSPKDFEVLKKLFPAGGKLMRLVLGRVPGEDADVVEAFVIEHLRQTYFCRSFCSRS